MQKDLKSNFNLDSFKVLLSGAYTNILISDQNLANLEDFLMSDESLQDEEMTKTKCIELYRAMTARQKNNIQLLTQLISISNRNEQIKLLLEELTKIKEINNKRDSVAKLPQNIQTLVAGFQKAMEEQYEDEYGVSNSKNPTFEEDEQSSDED